MHRAAVAFAIAALVSSGAGAQQDAGVAPVKPAPAAAAAAVPAAPPAETKSPAAASPSPAEQPRASEQPIDPNAPPAPAKKKRRKRSAAPPPPPVDDALEPPMPKATAKPAPRPAPPPAPAVVAPAIAPDSGGDVVESIGGDAPPAASAPTAAAAISAPPAVAPPSSIDKVRFRGYAISYGVFGAGRPAALGDPFALPYDGLEWRNQLFLETRYSHAGWFEAVASGLAGYGLYANELPGSRSALSNVGTAPTHGLWDPQLRELYVGLFWRSFDFRIGQQRLAWGKADAESPNDVLNARDRREPLLQEQELLHEPTPMARLDWNLEPFTLQLVGAPLFVPDKFDFYGTNWALIQPGAPLLYRGLFALASNAVDPSLVPAFQQFLETTHFPAADLSASTGGARLSYSGPIDADLYYHYGFDGLPLLQFDPRATALLSHFDFANAPPGAIFSLLGQFGGLPFSSRYVRQHHLGFDLGATVGSFSLRFDGAWDNARVFTQRDLNGFVGHTAEGVLSIEYQTGELSKTIILELLETHIFRAPPDGVLLFQNADLLQLAAYVRWLFFDHLELEIRGIASHSPQSLILRPQAGWKIGDLSIRVGGEVLGGDPDSPGGYFRRNRSVYMMLKASL